MNQSHYRKLRNISTNMNKATIVIKHMSFWRMLLDIIPVVLVLLIISKAIQIKKLTIEITENKPKHFHIKTSSAFLEKMPRNTGEINVSRKAEIEITKKNECFFIYCEPHH